MEELGKFLNAFIENHLLATIGAIFLSILSIAIIPDGFWMLNKLGIDWYRLFLFSFYFLLIKFVSHLMGVIPIKISNKRFFKKEAEKKQQDILDSWQNLFDHLKPYELELIKDLVKNNNNPVRRNYDYDPVLHSEYLHKEYRNHPYGGIPFVGEDDYKDEVFICATKYEGNKDNETRKPYKVYKLQEPAYIAAKHIIEKRGRLSTYEEIENYGDK